MRLEQLVNAELIFRRGTPPDAEYTFKHALVQDAAYGTLLRSRRQQIHARIIATLESAVSAKLWLPSLQLMAQHCAEAGLTEKAISYWLKAGQQAVARSAMAEAVAQLQKGLGFVAGIPDGPCRQQQELDLRIALGPALSGDAGICAPDVGENYVRARAALPSNRSSATIWCRSSMGQWVFHHGPRRAQSWRDRSAERSGQIGEAQSDRRRTCFARSLLARNCELLSWRVHGMARACFEQSLPPGGTQYIVPRAN